MYSRKFLGVFALVSILPCSGCAGPTENAGADRAFVNAAVYTVDDDRSWAEAVAITDGEILFVGSTDDAAAFIGDNTEVTDLDGKMLMPGFHDAHAHVRFGGLSESECDLQHAADIGRIRALLIECREAYDYEPDEWVVGGGWSLAAFPDANPSKDMLDQVFGARPVLIGDAFGHNVWVNSRALE
ncbi:MAG: amidohydrolase family protein, partial [Woeseia sp.]